MSTTISRNDTSRRNPSDHIILGVCDIKIIQIIECKTLRRIKPSKDSHVINVARNRRIPGKNGDRIQSSFVNGMTRGKVNITCRLVNSNACDVNVAGY
jgi:hypothetical protein